MRIVITVESYHSMRRYLEYYLATELTRSKQEVHIFSFIAGHKVQVEKDPLGFTVHYLPYVTSVGGYHIPRPTAIFYLLRFIKQNTPNIVHCQPLFSPLSLLFSLFRRRFGYKILGSLITGPYSIKSITEIVNYYLTKLVTEKYVIRVASVFFAKSEGLKKILTRLFHLDANQIKTVPLGTDPKVFVFSSDKREVVRKKLGYSDKDIVIISSGSIARSKQIHVLVESVIPLIKNNRQVRVLIVGEGNKTYLEHLKTMCIESGISQNVKFHTWIPHKKLSHYYSASDISVWPSGASISMIEAAACGLPIISSRSPIEEYVITPENGFVYEPGNAFELMKHLERLVENENLRRRMGQFSRKLVEDTLNWKSLARRYLQIYNDAPYT